MARSCGIDFFHPVKRKLDEKLLHKQLEEYNRDWVRIGCISDPSLDWDKTRKVCELVNHYGKTPVVITKVHKEIPKKHLFFFSPAGGAQIQVSVSALMTKAQERRRLSILRKGQDLSGSFIMRINSAVWKRGSKAERKQQELIGFCKDKLFPIPIIDTPLRLFKTSPIWKLVEQDAYHKHLSPISGKLDNQMCAGLIIDGAYPCYSSCSEGPTSKYDLGCPHQCCTRM